MLVGAGGNITVHAGNDGVLIVDSGLDSMSAKVIEAMRSISRGPLRYIVNTTERAEHVGGNAAIAAMGSTIPFRPPEDVRVSDGMRDKPKASVISFLTTLDRMSAPTGKVAPWPEDRLAGQHLLDAAEEALFQRRARADHARARDHRRQQRRALPHGGRHQRRRSRRPDGVSGHRREDRRVDRAALRWALPADRPDGPEPEVGSWHAGDPGSRPRRRPARRRLLPADGRHRPRPHQGHDCQGPDARSRSRRSVRPATTTRVTVRPTRSSKARTRA